MCEVGEPRDVLNVVSRLRPRAETRGTDIHGIAVVVFILLTGHIAGNGNRGIQYGMFQTAVAGRGTGVVVDGVGAGTAHIGAGITHVQVQRRGLRGLEITLEAEVVAGVVRTHHDGFLAQVGIADGPVVILSASGNREIRIPGISRAAEDGIHPVVGGQTEVHIHIVERAEVGIVHVGQVVAEGTEFILEFDEVLGIHHVDGTLMGHLLLSEVGVQFHRNLLSLLSALGRNDHDTVRTAATVDSGREGILQDVDGLDFRRGDVVDGFHRKTVHDVERAVVLGNGTATADTDLDIRIRIAFRRNDRDTGHTAGEGLRDGIYRLFGQLFTANGGNGAEQVAPLDHGITDHDDFIEEGGVFFQDDIDGRAAGDGNRLVAQADERKDQIHGIGRDVQGVMSVQVGHRTEGRALNEDTHADQRLALLVGHRTRNVRCLGRQGQADSQARQCENEFLYCFFHKN